MAIRFSLAALLVILSASTGSAATSIFYSGEVNLVLGGLPTAPAIGVDLDGAGEVDLSIESKEILSQTGAATYLTTLGTMSFIGSGGAITPLAKGHVFSKAEPTSSFTDEILTGFDFTEAPNDPGDPLGPYFSEASPQDYYWGFAFAGDTLGTVPGWMRVTVNPLTIDRDNETLSGGEIILREWAFDRVNDSIRVGQIPEPSAILQATLAVGAFVAARGSRGGRRR